MAEEIVVTAAAEVASKATVSVYDAIQRQISYVFKYQNYLDELKNQVDQLKNKRERVEQPLHHARRQGEQIYKDVEQWLTEVDKFTEDVVNRIIEDEDKEKKRCFNGLGCNLIKHYMLSKEAVKAANDGANLLRKGNFSDVSYRPVVQRAQSIYQKDYESFDSRMSNFHDIMQALKDSNVNMIGVYGMGGVGKTMLVKEVACQALEDKIFDTVVIVEVTQSPDHKKIQEKIAYDLGLEFGQESEFERGGRLGERLKKEKRVLIILDNIWAKLDLNAIGIPFADTKKGNTEQKVEEQEGMNDIDQRQQKILLTSRRQDVLCKDMKTQKNVLVSSLSYEDAWNLFQKIVGDSAEKSDFRPIADEIVKKCAGLPVAVATIANALKTESLYAWEDALDQLRRSNPRCIPDMDETLYSTIELSYKFLKNKEAKILFLLCGLYTAGHNIPTTNLLIYGMGLGLFRDVDTLEKGRNRVHTLIDNLKASCLLLDGDGDFVVKMHDIIHAVAVSIASTHELMFNIPNVTRLKQVLEEEIPKDSTAISMPYRDIHDELPERLEFQNLKLFLLLMKKNFSLQIPDLLFEGMKELKVLCLAGISILSLPSSLSCLTNLQTLCLNKCLLGDVATIGKLDKLEILRFSDSDIEQLPIEIGQLTRLRLLCLDNCSKLKVIAPNVLSSLSRLEELYMANSFVQWETVGLDYQGRSNASLTELKQLHHLTKLDIHVPDSRTIPHDFFFEKLEKYRIFIGDVWNYFGKYESFRILKLKIDTSIRLVYGIKILLKRAEDLYLVELNGVKNVLYELDGEGFPHLKNLDIGNSPELLCIVSSVDWVPCDIAFPILESLNLYNLINLEKICHGQLNAESFSKLRIIKIIKCDKLKYLFSVSMTKNLSQLEELAVIDCKNLKEVFYEEREHQIHQNERNDKVEFTHLRSIALQCLPQLMGFSLDMKTTSTSHMSTETNAWFKENIGDHKPEDFVALFSRKVMFPILNDLRLFLINVENIWLHQPHAMSSYGQTLSSLTVEECNGLKYLFSSSMVKSLVQLRSLLVGSCKSMEGIIDTDGSGEEKKMIRMIFPQLFYLGLKALPKLTRFGNGDLIEFPSLKDLQIESCPNLKTFCPSSSCASNITRREPEELNLERCPLFDEKVAFPVLEKITLAHLDNMQLIWNNQLHSDSFCKLKVLRVYFCGKLMTIIPYNSLRRLSSVEDLIVTDCGSIEQVFELEGLNVSEITVTAALQLKKLIIKRLPKLRHVWSKDPEGLLVFQNLENVCVFACWSLKCLFPISLATALMQLKHLQIESCGLEEIVAKDEVKVAPRFVFLQLTSLELYDLPKLKHFYVGLHSTEWPKLKSLLVCHCHELKIFAPEFLSFHNKRQPAETTIQQPLFLLEKVIPNLETLSLNNNDIKLISLGTFPAEIFAKVKVLQMDCFHDESAVVPFGFLQRFYSLKKLVLCHSDFKELFSCEVLDDEEKHTLGLMSIRNIKLNSLPRIQQIWKKDSRADPFLEKLETLEVWRCDCLMYLMPSSTSFVNLTTLDVWCCNRVANILSCSTAKSLAQLTTMRIRECYSVSEVIANEVDGIEGEVVFNQLKVLELDRLSRLACFCSANYAFKFPCLEEMTVRQCPKLKIFSQGFVSTPMLKRVQLTEQKKGGYCWIGWIPKYRISETLRLSSPGRKMEWPISIQCLLQLESLVVDKCAHIRSAVTANLLLLLNNLEKLDVKCCDAMEEIFDLEGLEVRGGGPFALLLQLSRLYLIDLPSLSYIWNKNDQEIVGFRNLKSLEIHNCNSLRYIFTRSVVSGLVQLREMIIIGCCMIKEIITKEGDRDAAIDKIVLPLLNNIILKSLANLTSFCPARNMLECPSLKTVTVEDCPKMETLLIPTDMGLCANIESSSGMKLSQLYLIDLPRLGHTSNKNYQEIVGFKSLKSLEIRNCNTLTYIFTQSVVSGLVQLREMKIIGCCMIKEIITREGDKDAAIDKIVLPLLNYIILKSLANLTSFCPARNMLECPSLKTVTVEDCPKMETLLIPTDMDLCANIASSSSMKVILPSRSSEWMCQNQLPAPDSCFQNLATLVIDGCDNLKCLISSYMVKSFVQLKVLKIINCKFMQVIVEEGERSIKMLLPKLSQLNLKDLPELSRFGTANLFEFPSLNDLWIESCPSLKSFISNSKCIDITVSKEIEGMNLENCHSDVHPLFDEKVSFPILEEMILSHLDNLQMIWHHLFHEDSFCELRVLRVKHCKKLLSIGPSDVMGIFSTLETLRISDCASLEELFGCQGLNVVEKAAVGEERRSKMLFPKLEHLKLKDLPRIVRFCNATGNFVELSSLSELWIENCPGMETFVSNSICPQPEERNFNVNFHTRIQPLFDKMARLPNLEKLIIDRIDELGKIWEDQLPLDSLNKLNCVGVARCNKLVNIFPSNMFGIHQKLENLIVANCDSLEEIFEAHEKSSCMVEGTVAQEGKVSPIVFPKLTLLHLKMLPSLKGFSSEIHMSEWPVLKDLKVYGCDKVERFASFMSFQETHGGCQHQIPVQRALFLVDKVAFPSLEELQLGKKIDVIDEIWCGKFLEYCNIKVLKLKHFSEKDVIFPSCFLHTLPHLEKLLVSDALFKEIFSCEGYCWDGEYVEAFSKFRDLKLSKLPELSYLWSKNSQPCRVFESLSTLVVSECGNLKYLVPSSVSFQNITTLEVSKCDGLMNLMTLSTAKSLVKLTKMNISNCKMIEEIFIQHVGDEVKERIVFQKLKYLELHCLPSLRSFCFVDHSLEFPSLEKVIVRQCSKMEIFSRGASSTPNLFRLQLTEGEEEDGARWEGNLNSSIQQLFKELNVQSSKED